MTKHWGICPIFHIGSLSVPSYEVLVSLAVLAALGVYLRGAERHVKFGKSTYTLLIAALIGGTLGAKLPIWVVHYREILLALPNLAPLLSGRTIVGGLIGGVLAVEFVKRCQGIAGRTGDLFAPALALGIGIGRIGCLLRGCCYGRPTGASWLGIDLGDGVPRYPTQIIESLFGFLLFVALLWLRKRVVEEGRLFTIFMLAYFTFRFGIEFLRQEPRGPLGLTLAQCVCLGVIGYYLPKYLWHKEPALVSRQDESMAGGQTDG